MSHPVPAPPKNKWPTWLIVLVVVGGALLLLFGGCTALVIGSLTSNAPVTTISAAPTPTPTPTETIAAPSATPTPTPTEPDPEPGTSLAQLASLEVKGRAPKTGYDRNEFGQSWKDIDRNGCGQRDDVLRRDLTDIVTRYNSDGCVVIEGTLKDPYTGEEIDFEKADASEVQIDHVVALSDAWQKGAQQWDEGRREEFANSFLNLLAVDGPTNASKGDGDAATWLPPAKGIRCDYVSRQIAVKAEFELWVTKAEHDKMAEILGGCEGQRPPTADDAKVPDPDSDTEESAPKPKKTKEPKPEKEPELVDGPIRGGAFCKASDVGKRGLDPRNGNTYICKSDGERNRWLPYF